MRLGDVPVSREHYRELGELVARSLPANVRDLLRDEVAGQAAAFLRAEGGNALIGRLLEGELVFEAGPADQRVTVTVTLDLGDLGLAHHLNPLSGEPVPLGRKGHHAVEADHTFITERRYEASSTRSLGMIVNVLTPFAGAGPWPATTAAAGLAVTGGSSSTYRSGYDAVQATKRAPRFEGMKAYFDFRGAALRSAVTPARPGRQLVVADLVSPPLRAAYRDPARAAAGQEPIDRAGGVRLTARASFPEEVAPQKQPGDPPGAFRPQPRTLTGEVLGVRQGDVDRGVPGARDQAARVADVLPRVLHTPEWVTGLQEIRAEVLRRLAPGGVLSKLDAKVRERAEFALSEQSVLRLFGEITGPGAVPPLLRDSAGTEVGFLRVTMRQRTAVASTSDKLGVKEEAQRFTNIWDGKTQGGEASLSLPMWDVGWTSDPTAELGDFSSVSVGGDVTGTISDSWSQAANTGSGDIRGMVIWGQSIRYLSDMHISVEIIRKADTAPAPAVTGVVTAAVRIPQIQQARYEHEMRKAADPGLPGATPVDDEPDPGNPGDLHPPASIASGQGIGFAAVSHLAGGQRVLPRLLDLAEQLGRDLEWSADWTPFERAYVWSQLVTGFGAEGLKSHAAELFQPGAKRIVNLAEVTRQGGLRMEISRPARSGTEILAFTVSASHGRTTTATGRVSEATLEVMPSTISGTSGGDAVGARAGTSAGVSGFAGRGTGTEPRTIGASVRAGVSRGVEKSVSTGAGAFTLEAMLYVGPARTFDYDLQFHLKVETRLDPKKTSPGVLHTAYHVARKALTGWRKPQRPRLGGSAEDKSLGGEVRFILHEKLARPVPETGAALDHVGHTERSRVFTARGQTLAGLGPQQVVQVKMPSIEAFAGTSRHVPLTPDDQLIEILGTSEVAETARELLASLGVKDTAVGNLPWALSSPSNLGATMIRGPSVIMQTIVQHGLWQDRHAVLTIELFPVDAEPRPGKFPLFQMHVAEGSPFVASSDTRSWTAGFVLGLPTFNFGGIGAQAFALGSWGHIWGKTRSDTTSLTSTAGRLTQATRNYEEYVGGYVARVTAAVRDKNFLTAGDLAYAGRLIKVHGGLTFGRPDTPAVDPRTPPPPPYDPQTIAVLGTRPAGPAPARPAGSRTHLVAQVPATRNPGETRMMPYVPPIPASGMVDRLYPPAAPHSPVPGGDAGVTGEGNPVLDGVRELLAAGAPELLERHWTVRGAGGTPVRQVGPRLQNILNLGSLTSLMDLLLSTGVVLTTVRPVPGGHERVQIVLRLHRDARNTGYTHLETVPGGNHVRYAFRLDARNKYWQNTRGSGIEGQEPELAAGTAAGANLTLGESAGPGAFENIARDFVVVPQVQSTQATTVEGYDQTVTAERDTLFIPGRADRYAGHVMIESRLTRTWIPSALARATVIPEHVMTWAKDARGTRRKTAATHRWLIERALIPEAMIHHDTLPQPPAGDIALVEEVTPGAPLRGQPLDITRAELLDRSVLNAGAYHEALRVLLEQLSARLRGAVAPANGDTSAAVRRMAQPGTRSDDALHNMLSHPMMTRHLEDMLGQPMQMPGLVEAGGPGTDTHGTLSVRARLLDPKIRGNYLGWLESVSYTFEESQRGQARSSGLSLLNISGGGQLNTGNLAVTDPLSPARRTLTGLIDPVAAGSTTISGSAAQQHMTQMEPEHRAIPRQRVSADAVFDFILEAQNMRDWIKPGSPGTWLGGGRVAVSFLVRNAYELHLTPEAALRHGLIHPGGIPVGSGTFYPGPKAARPATDPDLLRAASSVPFLNGMFGVQVHSADGTFHNGEQPLTTAELAAQIKIRLSQLPDPPPPGLSADEMPPPGPKRLNQPADPILLLTENAAVIQPGRAASPAQELADELGRPVISPRQSYRITMDGSVLALRAPVPGEPGFGHGGQADHFVVTFPSARGREPHLLPYELTAAISRARADLGWTATTAGRPPNTHPPSQDVHFGIQDAQAAVETWRRDITAAHQLAAAVRELLPAAAELLADSAEPRDARQEEAAAAAEAALEAADVAVRSVPAPEESRPAPGAADWTNRTRFQRAAAELGTAAAGVIKTAVAQWQGQAAFVAALPEAVRAVLPPADLRSPETARALGALDDAVRAVPRPPAVLPADAAGVTAAARAITESRARVREVSDAMASVLTAAVGEWDSRLATAAIRARAARSLLPSAEEEDAVVDAELREVLERAESALPERPELPLDSAPRMEAARQALAALAALESDTADLLTDATRVDQQEWLASA
ncbi:MAG TPA: hypothetical protein VK586_03670, partial [Streptosporangiaceae bacterium]|nr:hypothetical protein [Streptosporangiaceae bacterium]